MCLGTKRDLTRNMLVMKRKKKMLLPLRIEPVLKYSWSDFLTTTPQISHCGDSDNSKQFSNGLGW